MVWKYVDVEVCKLGIRPRAARQQQQGAGCAFDAHAHAPGPPRARPCPALGFPARALPCPAHCNALQCQCTMTDLLLQTEAQGCQIDKIYSALRLLLGTVCGVGKPSLHHLVELFANALCIANAKQQRAFANTL